MAVLARGSVTDRPWGLTFGALGVRGLTGQLVVDVDGKQYLVSFNQGAIIGAWSPLPNDAAVRVALTSNLITSTQVADITRRMAATPDREEVEVLAELARLSPDQARKLRRRLIAQRAARVGSLERGTFVVEDEITLPYVPGSELDIRAICYLAAKNNFSEERMGHELVALGGAFTLKQEAVEDLVQFGFTEVEKPVLEMLLAGAELADLEDAHPALGARAVRAVTYALVSCGACQIRSARRRPAITSQPSAGVPRPVSATASQGVPRPMSSTASGAVPRPMSSTASGAVPRPMSSSPSQAVPRPTSPTASQGIPRATASSPSNAVVRPPGTATPGSGRAPSSPPADPGSGRTPSSPPLTGRAPTPSSPPLTGRAPTPTSPPPSGRASTPTASPGRTSTSSGPPAPSVFDAPTTRGPAAAPPRRAKRNSAAALEVEQLLATKVPLLESHADHFALLGLTPAATVDEIRGAYFVLARKLHPDRLSAIGVVDDARNAQRLMAQINAAFAVLNDSTKRAEYIALIERGGEEAVRAQDAAADEMASRVLRAEEAFRQGEMALRRDQLPQAIAAFQSAVELQPNESEYQALLAWAQFAAAADKNAVATQTRRMLQRAAEGNDRAVTSRFYLGRVERMLGKEREALQHFQEVLRIKPNHSEAASEARVLEQRLKGRK